MLQRLQLRNFQCHDDLRIVLDPQVTTIVGPSDVGKSAVLRALCWIAENKPSGDAFVRNGESLCSVSLWLDERKVVRRKGKATNEMLLDGQVFRAFGADVPEPIADLFNVGDVNFQAQHDSPFWFSLTAGQVSRELNGVINLDVIDRTLAGVASALRKARAVEEVCRDRLEETQKQIEELDWVPGMVEEHDVLEDLENVVLKMDALILSLQTVAEEGRECEKRASAEIPDMGELEDLRSEVIGLTEEETVLSLKVKEGNSLADTMINRGKEIEELERRLEEESGGVCPLCGSELKEVLPCF